jgi:DNA-binding LytR/AlgR family response regulator
VRTLIVDDEAVARRRMRRLVDALGDLEVVGEAADGREALDAIRALRPELVFLDIRMPEIDGLDLAFCVAGGPAVIFVTAYDEYAVRAFEAAAVDYLLKPVDPERLAVAVARARGRAVTPEALELALRRALRRPDPQRIAARRGDTVELLDPQVVPRVRAEQGYAVLSLGGHEYVLDESLVALEARLAEWGFVRTHRAELVNLHHVRTLRRDGDAGWLDLADGQSAPVSRRFLPEVKRRLGL